MELVRNFVIGEEVVFNNSLLRIINYAGTAMYRSPNGVAEMQLYEVEFNGERLFASDAGIISGNPNLFTKVIAGVGYRGNVDFLAYDKEYCMWKDMIYRCVNENNRLYPYYGGLGVTIDPRWLCFEIFLYDFVNVQNYDKVRSKSSFVIDIVSKQKNIPEGERIYAPGKIAIKQYYSSDVYENLEKAKKLGNNQEVGRYANSADIRTPTSQAQVTYQPLPNGNYPEEAYEAVIRNPPQLPIPSNDDLGHNVIRTFNGVYHKDRPPLKPVMCTIVNKK